MGDRSYLHSLESGALLPGIQATLTGVFVSFIVAGGAWLFGINVGAALVLGGGAAAALCWLYLLKHWLYLTSPAIPADIVIDGGELQPERYPEVRIELKQERSISFIDLPAEPEQLAMLARGLLAGAPFSEAHWTGSRGLFSRSQFGQLRAELLKRHLLTWRNDSSPSQGVELTVAGRALLSHFVDSPTPAELIEQ